MAKFEQLTLPIDFLPPMTINRMIRSCPNNPEHTVFGTPANQGGNLWLCSDCGIQWRIDKRLYLMVYEEIYEDGETFVIKTVPLYRYPELKNVLKCS